jgi:hypothetical protein
MTRELVERLVQLSNDIAGHFSATASEAVYLHVPRTIQSQVLRSQKHGARNRSSPSLRFFLCMHSKVNHIEGGGKVRLAKSRPGIVGIR